MKNRFSKRIIILFLMVFIMLFSVSAGAAQKYPPIETERKCSLKLTYHSKDTYFEGMEIQLFHAANASPETKYTLTDTFKSYPVDINATISQTEWNSLASTLTAYVTADAVTPTQEKTTDKNGAVRFKDLSAGLYLVRWTKNQTKDIVNGFEPFLIAVPNLNDNGTWEYDIDCYPKSGDYTKPTNEEIEYKAVVLWNDTGFENQRPDSVQIEVFKDGVSAGVYTISSSDNWTFTWKTIDDGSEWTVVEHVTGLKYNITVSRKGNVFTIVNYYRGASQSPQPEKPNNTNNSANYNNNSQYTRNENQNSNLNPLKTGDNSEYLYYIAVISIVSGIISVNLAIYGRRINDDE